MVPKARLKINFKNLQNTSEHYQQIVGFCSEVLSIK